MENDDRSFARLAVHLRDGYHTWVRFMSAIYGGEPAAKAAEIAALEHLWRNSADSTEKAP
jgi:hypothetical protein